MAENVWQGKAVQAVPALLAGVQRTQSDKQVTEAVHHLRTYFVEALHAGIAQADASSENSAAKMVKALLDQYSSCQGVLLSMLQEKRSSELQLACLNTIMDFTRAEHVGRFQDSLFRKAMHTMVTSKHVQPEVLRSFASKFSESWDVRYHVLCEVRNTARQDIVQDAPNPREGSKARRKRKRLDEQQDKDKPSGPKAQWASPSAQLSAYSEAWMAFLQIPLPKQLLQEMLPELTTTVMRHIKNPVALSDFFTKAVDQGGLSGILALQGLFFLVTQHGLEHPEFYERLYSLLVPQVFTARYRAKFLQLTDIFLASSMVPAYTAAAFAKRFARLALSVPPAGALCCMAFAHNLIRRHPGCMCLIHRPNDVPGPDSYDPEAPNLDGSKGIESCLWELAAFKAHLNPTVADASGMFDRKLSDRKRVAEMDISTFLSDGYAVHLSSELDKTLRRAPEAGAGEQPQLARLPGFSM